MTTSPDPEIHPLLAFEHCLVMMSLLCNDTASMALTRTRSRKFSNFYLDSLQSMDDELKCLFENIFGSSENSQSLLPAMVQPLATELGMDKFQPDFTPVPLEKYHQELLATAPFFAEIYPIYLAAEREKKKLIKETQTAFHSSAFETLSPDELKEIFRKATGGNQGCVRHQRFGEVGLSTMGGVYNRFQVDGLALDKRRRVDVIAIDVNTGIKPWGTSLIGEWAWVMVDVPDTYTQQYGSAQHGGFLDIVQPLYKGSILGFNDAVLNFAVRAEYVDWNVGTFGETNTRIGDKVWAIVPALSFRPVPVPVLRLNYRHERATGVLGNPPSRTGGLQFGVSIYF